MEILDLLGEFTGSITADPLSPIHCFFKLTTIARMVVLKSYEGKGRMEIYRQDKSE
jgi:hypothetical protein